MGYANDTDPHQALRHSYQRLAQRQRDEADRCRREARIYRNSAIVRNCLEAAAAFEQLAQKFERMAGEVA